ncbi:MAG: xylulokinase [Clostridia bacterium]|nr:xylulokinase [Clostridia bacterium]
MKYLIGIDIGTSATKSALFDTEGNLIRSASAEYPMMQPEIGWAEENPEDFWRATCKTLREITDGFDGEIVGIGLSGQMHSLVMLDERDEVIRPAILWCDQRTAKECEELTAIIGNDELVRISGNTAMPAFTASKLMWVRNNEPENFKRCKHVLLAKDYVRFKLTGEYVIDVSDASGMQLMDIKTKKYSKELSDAVGIDEKCLPRIMESYEVSGRVTDEAAALTGVKAGTVVAAGAGDNAAAAVGTGVVSVGDAFTTIGTSGVVFIPTESPICDRDGRFNCFCDATGSWHVLGITQAAGLSMNWFRSSFAKNLSYREIDEGAAAVPVGSEKLVYLPYLMGERTPILDSSARGVFFGLSAVHTSAHLARAVMEGVSYSLYSCLEAISASGIEIKEMSLCGGGAKSPLWHGMLSDVYGIPVKTMISTESASLGAAILGGCAAGVYSSVAEGSEICVRANVPLTPNAENHEKYMKLYSIYKELYPVLKDSFRELNNI